MEVIIIIGKDNVQSEAKRDEYVTERCLGHS